MAAPMQPPPRETPGITDAPLWRELPALWGSPRPRFDARWADLHDVLAGRPARPGVDWAAVAEAAHLGEVVGVVADHPALQPLLAQSVRRQVLVDMNLELALDRAARAFARAGVERAVLLKGAVTAPTLYHPPWRRARRDIDVLVAREELVLAIEALEADGWRGDPMPGDEALGPLAVGAWPVVLDLPMGPMSCDLHQRLFSERGYDIDHDGILARRVAGLAPLPVSSPEDTFIHTALHLARSGFQEPLKAWVDLLYLARAPQLDLHLAARRARAWRAGPALWACMHVLARWLDGPGPEVLGPRSAPPRAQRALLARLLSGTGADPLRQPVSRRAAVGASALLVIEGARAHLAYLRGVVARRRRP